jgi:UDP-N-acetylglucosamine acyltransferase
MSGFHSTALISKNAKIGMNVSIGAYSIIYDDVEIGDNTVIGSNSVIYNGARIGNNVRILNFASVAHIPQDKKFHNEYSLLYIGDNSIIGNFTTLHRGTEATGKTVIGENVIVSHYSHIAHDCLIGNSVYIGSMVQIGGHVEIDEFSVIKDFTQIHQFCRVGKYVTLEISYKITMDIPPYIYVSQKPLRFMDLNFELFNNHNFSQEKVKSINDVYSILYFSGLNFSQAKEKIKNTFPDNPVAKELLEFIEKSSRGIIGK